MRRPRWHRHRTPAPRGGRPRRRWSRPRRPATPPGGRPWPCSRSHPGTRAGMAARPATGLGTRPPRSLSRSTHILLTSDLLIPVTAPSAFTRSFTLRLEVSLQICLHDHREQRLVPRRRRSSSDGQNDPATASGSKPGRFIWHGTLGAPSDLICVPQMPIARKPLSVQIGGTVRGLPPPSRPRSAIRCACIDVCPLGVSEALPGFESATDVHRPGPRRSRTVTAACLIAP